jgi:hypothetical protein
VDLNIRHKTEFPCRDTVSPFEICATELMALLLECSEGKSSGPCNRALKRFDLNMDFMSMKLVDIGVSNWKA